MLVLWQHSRFDQAKLKQKEYQQTLKQSTLHDLITFCEYQEGDDERLKKRQFLKISSLQNSYHFLDPKHQLIIFFVNNRAKKVQTHLFNDKKHKRLSSLVILRFINSSYNQQESKQSYIIENGRNSPIIQFYFSVLNAPHVDSFINPFNLYIYHPFLGTHDPPSPNQTSEIFPLSITKEEENYEKSNGYIALPKKQRAYHEKQNNYIKKNIKIIFQESFIQKRNIIPNNINHILSFIQRKKKSSLLIEKIIKKSKNDSNCYSTKRFYAYQIYIKGKLSVHVNKETLAFVLEHVDLNASIFSVEEQLFYNRVSRVAVLHYLKTIAPLITLNSKRLAQTNKFDHLRSQRNLIFYLKKSVFFTGSQTSF